MFTLCLYPPSGYLPRQAGFPNDIAIVTLASNASITQAVKTAPLAPVTTLKSENMTGCVISGWGHMIGGIDGPPSLHPQTTINVISADDCTDKMSNITNAEIFDHHICVFETPKAACNGDSGGPLVCDGVLVGVSSYGVRSCTGRFPSIFGFVPHFYDWILTHMLD
ncbi:unnamed protein product [Candidula unifasciata]|uniref:Peptidase S1 domain-containing protein n=1 Tax=Candidula unifasciata TaxID=100452 RepID=A0A8S3ZXS6_9EUPU|nr:unnamed protein product [Candidula unifasciata]